MSKPGTGQVVAFKTDAPEGDRVAAAKRIRELMQDWSENTIELGRELIRARSTFPVVGPNTRPGWHTWLEKETGLGREWATKLIRIAEKLGGRAQPPKNLSLRVLAVLAQDSIPEEARQDVIERAERGEKISREEAKRIADEHRLPKPKAANEQAKEEGRPVLASDGYIYFGTSPDKAKEGEDRRTMVYGVKRALDTLGGIQLTARQFLNYAQPHQLWSPEEAKIIKRALRWLESLDEAWDAWEPPKTETIRKA